MDRTCERLSASHQSQSPRDVRSIQLFEKILPLFCRQLPVYIFNNTDTMLRGAALTETQISVNSLGERLTCWRPSFQTAVGQLSQDSGLEETVTCSLLPEIKATCILGIWWAKIPFL